MKTVLKGARSRYRKAPKKAEPLSRDHLVRVVQACDDAIVAAAQLDDPKQSLAQARSAGRDKAFFLLGFWCAFRSDELVNLRWEYLTFGEGRDAKTGQPRVGVVPFTKCLSYSPSLLSSIGDLQ